MVSAFLVLTLDYFVEGCLEHQIMWTVMHLQYDQILHYMNVPFIFFSYFALDPWPWASKGFEKTHQKKQLSSKIVVKINILV